MQCPDGLFSLMPFNDDLQIDRPRRVLERDRLEAKDLVERRKSETDRRQTNVLLTDAGRQALLSAPDALQDEYVKRFDGLKVWEQAMIVAALERVSSLMDADDLEASPLLDLGDIHTTGRE